MNKQKKLREALHKRQLEKAQIITKNKHENLARAVNIHTYTRSLVLSVKIGLMDDFDLSAKEVDILLYTAIDELYGGSRRRKKACLDPYAKLLKE